MQQAAEIVKSKGIPTSLISSNIFKEEKEGVYIIRCNEYCKIGRTGNIGNRIDSIRTSNPYPVELLLFLSPNKSKEIEKELHEIFKINRHTREWFLLTNEDILKAVEYIEKEWIKQEYNK